ncbi:tyrosine-protein kinase family protein [Thalassobius sp. MITS945101]|uniref:tyrosine-protein kinase family protein n=1 Tax=Thalassobius sp. MITS945101 TaxID=3096994 RepID=UPI00399A9287
MVEQSKRFRRGMRQQKARGGLLSGSGRSAAEIAAEDTALRSAFPMIDLEAEAETVAEAETPTSAPEPVEAPSTKPAPLALENPLPVAEDPAAHSGEASNENGDEDEDEGDIVEVDDVWPQLGPMPVQRNQMAQNLIITASRRNPVHAAFDVLRARLLNALTDNGWKRVAITSPTRDCGKTFVSVNLAVTLSRYENCRTILLDMDMRNPSVAKTLGLRDVGSMGDYLRGEVPTRDQFFKFDSNDMKIGDNLAIAMNDRIEPYASELMQQPATAELLQRMEAELSPDVILYDLPPALANDDVIAFEDNFDGVLIVIDGTRTSGQDVREVMRRLGDSVPLLGVVLNKAEDATGEEYGY